MSREMLAASIGRTTITKYSELSHSLLNCALSCLVFLILALVPTYSEGSIITIEIFAKKLTPQPSAISRPRSAPRGFVKFAVRRGREAFLDSFVASSPAIPRFQMVSTRAGGARLKTVARSATGGFRGGFGTTSTHQVGKVVGQAWRIYGPDQDEDQRGWFFLLLLGIGFASYFIENKEKKLAFFAIVFCIIMFMLWMKSKGM